LYRGSFDSTDCDGAGGRLIGAGDNGLAIVAVGAKSCGCKVGFIDCGGTLDGRTGDGDATDARCFGDQPKDADDCDQSEADVCDQI